MKLEVLNWLGSELKSYLGRTVEFIFRLIILFLPLGVFLLLIQNRNKVSSTSNLSVFTTDKSVWQHVFPGFILVALNRDELKNFLERKNASFQTFIQSNKYTLGFLFALALVLIMLLRKGA